MAWAKRLEQDGTFLEFPDLFLWASQKGYDLKVLVWKEGLRVVDIVGGVGCSLFWSILIKFGYRRVRNKVGPCINRWGFHIRIIRCANLMDNPIPYHPDWYVYLHMNGCFLLVDVYGTYASPMNAMGALKSCRCLDHFDRSGSSWMII